jgi:hypothetical protein
MEGLIRPTWVGINMDNFDAETILKVLRDHKDSLAASDPAREEVINEVKARLTRSADDRKEGAKIAVETAKLFVTIGVAVLVAFGTFLQFARNAGVPWKSWVMAAFAGGALLVLLSMSLGFTAISRTYKRAEGRIDDPKDLAWSTQLIAGQLNGQSLLGIASLFCLIAGLGLWAWQIPTQPTSVSVTLNGSSSAIPAPGPMIIDGIWTSLILRTAAGQELTLPPNSKPIALACR